MRFIFAYEFRQDNRVWPPPVDARNQIEWLYKKEYLIMEHCVQVESSKSFLLLPLDFVLY